MLEYFRSRKPEESLITSIRQITQKQMVLCGGDLHKGQILATTRNGKKSRNNQTRFGKHFLGQQLARLKGGIRPRIKVSEVAGWSETGKHLCVIGLAFLREKHIYGP